MITDDQNYYDQKNFVRDDWGGQVRTPQSGKPSEDQSANFNIGSDNKPYPNNRNFVVGQATDGFTANETEPSMPSTTNPDMRLGQVKYARREGAVSIYKDGTRNTANDNAASAKAEGSTMGANSSMDDDYEENQGGSQ